ncbi:hypothetical protein SORBI_3007G093400 [Sorghum bicolor]|uniref:Uncharacterized protein n=1 Tax=Sorghum bicolor TaxID=4558 RepID=A0A1B6PGN1_SORBI|nr:hypothetical protein SORBI_3007G093400 [Sorghum bicolor]
MAVLQDHCTHRHKERKRICGTVEQHATAMAQQAQEPARWLSAKSRIKNRTEPYPISHPITRLPARGLGTRIHPITKRGNNKKRQSPCRLDAEVGTEEIRGSVAEVGEAGCSASGSTVGEETGELSRG